MLDRALCDPRRVVTDETMTHHSENSVLTAAFADLRSDFNRLLLINA
jgi:hypothetical protein